MAIKYSRGHLAQELEHFVDIEGVRGANPLVPTMFIGAHVSITGGFDRCIDRIVDIGGNCLMTFASSPRSLATREFSPNEIDKYIEKKSQNNIGPHFFHAVYLVNLATSDPDYLKASINSLIFYQNFASQIKSVGTIFHIGSHKGLGLNLTIDQVVESINFILDSSPKNTKLIIENCAGQGGTIGRNFSEISQILFRIGDKSKIGVCLDTQHAFASGYDLSTLLDKFDKEIGRKYLSVIHLNDSIPDFASQKDRHANLGEGTIGLEKLSLFANDQRLKAIPLILEVPGHKHSGPRKEDIQKLKSLIN